MNNFKITVIGDLHGKYDKYHEIISKKENSFSIQLGDFGFNYETLKNIDPKNHIFIGGNHDNYDIIEKVPNYLGDFGYVLNFNGVNFFYYRGANSIDKVYRTVGINWWEKEELSFERFMKAKDLYESVKPDIFFSHDCPIEIIPYLLPAGSKICKNNTNWALNELFKIHQPKVWRFGHYHKSWEMNINGTNFKCLNELETCTI